MPLRTSPRPSRTAWETTGGPFPVRPLNSATEAHPQKGQDVATTHLENMITDRDRRVNRAVHDELLQLAARRAEQHAKEQNR